MARVRTLEVHERDAGTVAELALASCDLETFRHLVLRHVDARIGFDAAAMLGATGTIEAPVLVGYDDRFEVASLNRYMAEFAPDELRALSGNLVVDTDLIAKERRDTLGLYTELLRPRGISVLATAVFREPHGTHGFHLARAGRSGKFRARELSALAAMIPSMRVAERYFVAAEMSRASERFHERWFDAFRLSAREREVTSFVARGMQNPEIGALLGVSTNTIRNQLASVFRKAGVSTRAELVFMLGAGNVVDTATSRSDASPSAPAWSRHIVPTVRGR